MPSPTMLNLALQVFDSERARRPEATTSATMFAALRTLADGMAKLVGVSGFEALLRRAIDLTRREHTWLEPVQLGARVPLDHLAAQVQGVSEPEATAGCLALFATVLELLTAFLGADLTARQVRLLWSEITFEPRAHKETR